jgi:hypothetical protein
LVAIAEALAYGVIGLLLAVWADQGGKGGNAAAAVGENQPNLRS